MRRRLLICLTTTSFAMTATGCIVVHSGGDWWGWSTCYWTDEVTEELAVDAAGFQTLNARTHNGPISYTGQSDAAAEPRIMVTKKGGGRSPAAAQEALEAIDVFVTPSGNGKLKVGWKWRNGIRHSGWNGYVGFEITGPAGVDVVGETHNGPVLVADAGSVRADTHNGRIEIEGAAGDVRAITHNGSISIEATRGKLYAESHNGWIRLTTAADELSVVTHNGEVVADLAGCGALDGDIVTHNGAIEVVVGEATSADLRCETNNGSIKCNVPVSDLELTRHRLTGTIGSGKGRLDITTHNGGIQLRTAG
jgi:hypothetical protein